MAAHTGLNYIFEFYLVGCVYTYIGYNNPKCNLTSIICHLKCPVYPPAAG